MSDFASLVVLSYNRPHYLERSLDSLKNAATGIPYELIVVDDGSTAACRDLLVDRFKRGDISSLVLNGGENQGIGVGMNRGFSIARGRWIAKLDADLYYEDCWLDRAVGVLDHFPDIACVGLFLYDDPARFAPTEDLCRNGEAVAKCVPDFMGSAFVLRREDWLRHGVIAGKWHGFDEHCPRFAEDSEWKEKMKARGFKLAVTHPDCVSNFGFGSAESAVHVDRDGVASLATISRIPKLFGGKHSGR